DERERDGIEIEEAERSNPTRHGLRAPTVDQDKCGTADGTPNAHCRSQIRGFDGVERDFGKGCEKIGKGGLTALLDARQIVDMDVLGRLSQRGAKAGTRDGYELCLV